MMVFEGNNEEYEQSMLEVLKNAKAEGIKGVAFGDIFLEDLRLYRENQMREIGMECLFPIWKKNTANLVTEFLSEGFKTIICCISDEQSHWWRGLPECGSVQSPPNVYGVPSCASAHPIAVTTGGGARIRRRPSHMPR